MIRYFATRSLFHRGMDFRNAQLEQTKPVHPSVAWLNCIYIYQERTIIYIYVYIYITIHMSYAADRCMGFVCSYFEFLKLNVKYNDVKYAIVYFRKNNWCVTFVNLLENQQTPLYFTLYRGYYYRLRNQFTLKELKTMYSLKSSIQQKQFRFNTGCWTQCLWARRWVE